MSGAYKPILTHAKRKRFEEAVRRGLFSYKIGDYAYPISSREEFSYFAELGDADIKSGVRSEYADLVQSLRHKATDLDIKALEKVMIRNPLAFLEMRDRYLYGQEGIERKLQDLVDKLEKKEPK